MPVTGANLGDNSATPFTSSRPDGWVFCPSSVCCMRNKPPFFFLTSFSISDLGSLAGGNTEELGCNVKLQVFFVWLVFFPWDGLMHAARGILEGGEKPVNGAVRCFSFAFWKKRVESCPAARGEWRQTVLSVQDSPLGAVWELAWSWDGCHGLHPGCLRVRGTSGSVPGSRGMGRGAGDGEQEESCVVF